MIKINRDLKRLIDTKEGWSIIAYDNKDVQNHCILQSPLGTKISIDKYDVVNNKFSFVDYYGMLKEICEGKY